jgi:hypothetical protein
MIKETPRDEDLQPLVDAVTEGFDPVAETDAIERTAAAVHAALLLERGLEPLPKALQRRLMASIPRNSAPPVQAPILRPDFGTVLRVWGGWLAAAACLLFAVTIGVRHFGEAAGASGMALSTRIQELERAPDLIRISLPPKGSTPGTPSGEILWSNGRQDGVLRLRGLKPNDRLREQYQLWIVDPRRDASAPVDGGVFDIASETESVVPIESKLKILSPKAFVITREHPGGVVKSQSKNPVLVASVQ